MAWGSTPSRDAISRDWSSFGSTSGHGLNPMLDVKWLKTLMIMKEVEIGQLLAMEERRKEEVGGGRSRKGGIYREGICMKTSMKSWLAEKIFGIWLENEVGPSMYVFSEIRNDDRWDSIPIH